MRTSRVLGAAVFLCTISSALLAQGWIDPERPVRQVSNGPIERLRSAVQVSISGRVARVTVEEWFRNNGPVLNEGMYHFPPRRGAGSDTSPRSARDRCHGGGVVPQQRSRAERGDVSLPAPRRGGLLELLALAGRSGA